MAKQRLNEKQTDAYIELGRYTATGAVATMATPTFAAKKYLKIVYLAHSGGSVTLTPYIRFNGDAATNYQYRASENAGADVVGTSQTGFQMGSNALQGLIGELLVINEAAYHKVGSGVECFWDASNLYRITYAAKWNNTAQQITQVSFVATAGSFQAGSEIIVYGRD